jgi:hypothetical protein
LRALTPFAGSRVYRSAAGKEEAVDARARIRRGTEEDEERRRIAVRLSAPGLRQGVLIVNIAWRIRYFGGSDRELWRPVDQTKRTES